MPALLPIALPTALTLLCMAGVALQIAADRRAWPRVRALAKLGASSCFVALAVALDADQSAYGRLVLGALLLGWLGDALLLSRRTPAFMAGLGAFLLAHALYAAAFAGAAPAPVALAIAAAVAVVTGAWALRWLWPHVPGRLRGPVVAYVVIILAMCVTAAGHAAGTGRWGVLVGALLFAVSDVAVARDRFIARTHANHLWGWPTYFGAQLVLAWSVVGGGIPGSGPHVANAAHAAALSPADATSTARQRSAIAIMGGRVLVSRRGVGDRDAAVAALQRLLAIDGKLPTSSPRVTGTGRFPIAMGYRLIQSDAVSTLAQTDNNYLPGFRRVGVELDLRSEMPASPAVH